MGFLFWQDQLNNEDDHKKQPLYGISQRILLLYPQTSPRHELLIFVVNRLMEGL